jgi:hypothetical protein
MCKYATFTAKDILGMRSVSRADIEQALDTGKLYVRMRNGNNWRVRRNGKTQTWVTRPDDFRIPCKAGLKLTFQIEHTDLPTFGLYYVIQEG